MENRLLRMEPRDHRGTDDVRHCHSHAELTPAFLDKRTGRIEIARTRVGLPASTHLIDWLPREWARSITHNGRVRSLKPDIIAGYVSNGVFFTREEIDDD